VSKRYNNIIHKQFLKSKTIKAIPSSTTRIRLTVRMEDPKETFSVDYTHIKNTKVEETTTADIVTTGHPIRSNTTSVINLDTSQVSI
jgi:hypothetical protein